MAGESSAESGVAPAVCQLIIKLIRMVMHVVLSFQLLNLHFEERDSDIPILRLVYHLKLLRSWLMKNLRLIFKIT